MGFGQLDFAGHTYQGVNSRHGAVFRVLCGAGEGRHSLIVLDSANIIQNFPGTSLYPGSEE